MTAPTLRNLPEPIAHAIESGKIPSPPQVLLRLMEMVDDDQATVGELAELVGQDAGLSARVLTAANSPALRRGTELKTIDKCLVALGTRLVRSIATCLSIQSLFDRREGLASLDISRFWAHSLWVAELSRSLAEAADYPQPDEAYLAGLLHDVGELILLSVLGNPYGTLLSSYPDGELLQEQETATFSVNHAEIGTYLADTWQLDAAFADGILFHHLTAEQILTADALPQIVWLANALTAEPEIPAILPELFREMFGDRDNANLTELRDLATRRTLLIGEAMGFNLPEKMAGIRVWENFKPFPETPPADDDPSAEIAAMVGGMALLQPIQQDLFTLESNAEILISLRESARILFNLNKLAFLLITPPDGRLSGSTVGGQPAIFRQIKLPIEAQRSVAATAALKKAVCSTFAIEPGQTQSLIDVQLARALGSDGLLCIPMVARHQTIGVMVCGLSEAGYARIAKRLPWMLNFGKVAALSLQALQEAQDYREQADNDASERFTRQARRVIHEARNPLGIIKSYLKIVDRKLPEETGVRQELEVLAEEIDRVATIVGRMSEMPAEQATHGGFDLTDVMQEMLLLYGNTLFEAKGIRTESNLPAEPLRVRGDRNSLKQILLNLWKNASEALAAGQQIKISLTDHVIHNGQAYVQIRMDDNGPGMSDEVMRSIYRPAEEVGSSPRGNGLAIVGELASRQKIPVTCRSQAGKGTSIALLLPKDG